MTGIDESEARIASALQRISAALEAPAAPPPEPDDSGLAKRIDALAAKLDRMADAKRHCRARSPPWRPPRGPKPTRCGRRGPRTWPRSRPSSRNCSHYRGGRRCLRSR
ncbi:MAG: hypothetical protein JKP98_20600 [Rhodobacteraceae bacterium]|nr:hypothetical protein [Paracoccaceae bacterium]